MYNLRKFNGSFKGLIGECMFKLTRNNLFITRFHSFKKFIHIFGHRLSDLQMEFLSLNWYSIDAVEIIEGAPVIFEIKTRNYYKKYNFYKPKHTQHTVDIYLEAKRVGFIVNLATVWLYDDWDFNIDVESFSINKIYIDTNKKYDFDARGD